MDLDKLRKSVEVNLRCVTQSSKGGVPLYTLQSDYIGLIGKPIPFTELGYQSLELFLQSIPDVVRLNKGKDGNYTVEGVADSSTAHIASLISRQKTKTTKKGNTKKASLSIKKYSHHESWRSASNTPKGNWRITGSTSNPTNLNATVLKTNDTKVTTSTGSKLTTANKKVDISQQGNITKDCLLEEATSDSVKSYSSLSTENVSRPSTPFSTSSKADSQQNISPHVIQINIDSEELSSPLNLSIDVTSLSKTQRKEIIRKALLKNLKKCKSPYSSKNQQKQFRKKIQEIDRLCETEIALQMYKEKNVAAISPNENQVQDSCETLEVSPSIQKKQLKKFTIMNLKKLFLSNNDGLLLSKLQGVYKKMFGTFIVYKDMDYKTLKAFIQDIPDIINTKIRKEDGEIIVQSVDLCNLEDDSLQEIFEKQGTITSAKFFTQSAVEEIPPPVAPPSVLPSFNQNEPSCSSKLPPPVPTLPVLPSFHQKEPCDITSSRVTNTICKASLNSFPNIKYSVSSAKFSSLLMMNLLLFGDDSYTEILKRGVLAFDGFNFSVGSEQWNERETFFFTLPEETLRECLKLLCIDCDIYNKKGLVQKLMQFLSSPGRAYSERNHHCN